MIPIIDNWLLNNQDLFRVRGYDMEAIPALLALCEVNPPLVTSGSSP